MLERALGLLRHVDLSLLEPLDQIVGRYVDKLDGVGSIEDRVRHRLAHPDARDLRHHVVQTFDVLDVERRIDVDPLAQQLLDIEVAFRVPAASDIGVSEFVDESELRIAGDKAVQVHLLEMAVLISGGAAWNDFKVFQQRFSLFAAVSLDHADDDIHAFFEP